MRDRLEPTTRPASGIDQDDPGTAAREYACTDQAGQAGADHRDVVALDGRAPAHGFDRQRHGGAAPVRDFPAPMTAGPGRSSEASDRRRDVGSGSAAIIVARIAGRPLARKANTPKACAASDPLGRRT